MSDMQIIMKFELLPNEIFIECFEYLNAIDIFYSFDQLNYHFNTLIRSIPLHLDFQHVRRSIFDEFCMKMSLNQEIKKQIYSLHLSNQGTSYMIQPFLSLFSLDEFIHLRSLTLTAVTENNKSKLMSILPSLSQLICFRLMNSIAKHNEILSALPTSQIRIIMISFSPWNFNLLYEFPSITTLTIVKCHFNHLCEILNNPSRLKYLSIEQLSSWKNDTMIKDMHLNNLSQLIIINCDIQFDYLAMILEKTPTLKSLTISSYGTKADMVDACKWQHLITSSLLQLKIFKFKFTYFHENEKVDIHEKFKQFQSDFWQSQHNWYTEYSLYERSALIYTIPHAFDTYELRSKVNRYSSDLINYVETFENVGNLTINPNTLVQGGQYYFFHVTSLTLADPWLLFYDYLLKLEQIEYLKMTVNLSNVKYLAILPHCKLETTFVLKEILKEAPKISSLNITPDIIKSLFDDDDLCEDLNKKIKTVQITNYSNNSFDTLYDLSEFCKIFINIEQLMFRTNQADFVLFILKNLPKLSRMTIPFSKTFFALRINEFEDELQKQGVKITAHFDVECCEELSIWIFRNMY